MHVLYVSDVYFPRVNGVSTSIHTFRTDLAALGVTTTLVAPDYPAARPTDDDANVLRVRSGAVPRDPEDRRMHRGALRATLASPALRDVDLVHIQTPFVAHYAGASAARRLGVPVIATYHTFFEEYLHHYVPVLPRAWGRALARRFTRSQCAAVDSLIAPSDPMRASGSATASGRAGRCCCSSAASHTRRTSSSSSGCTHSCCASGRMRCS